MSYGDNDAVLDHKKINDTNLILRDVPSIEVTQQVLRNIRLWRTDLFKKPEHT